MDGQRFDRWTRALASGTSRRAVLKGLLGLGGSATAVFSAHKLGDARTAGSRPVIAPPPTPTPTPAPACNPGFSLCGGSCCPDNQCANGVCCQAGTAPCLGGCCDDASVCCERDGCCAGRCTIAGACCPAGNTVCGADCCSPEDQCCGNECCPGVCYGAETCCPRPRLFNETSWVCCEFGTRPCGELCIPGNSCCDDTDCTAFSISCHTGRCAGSGGACIAEPLPDGSPVQAGVSVCIGGAECVMATCGPADCGTITESQCGQTIQCPTCNGDPCGGDGECLSGSCYQGLCADPAPTGGPCDTTDDCQSGICDAGFCRQEIGGTCLATVDCAGNLVCDSDQTCRVELGAACIVDSECRAGQECRTDGVCAISLNQPCVFLDECSDGLTCSCFDIFVDVCQTPCTPRNYCKDAGICKVPPGGSCTETSQCPTFFTCSTTSQTCEFELQPVNGGCFDDTYCQEGLVCVCPNGSCGPDIGACKASLNGACSVDSDCVAGLICNTVEFGSGPASFCQIPLGESCDGSLQVPFVGLQCETGACGPTFFRPAEENPVCCLQQGETCASDDECCKLPNPLPLGPPYSWTRCRSSGICGRVGFIAGGPCLTAQDCAPAQICAPDINGSLICQAPPTPIGSGGECDPTGANIQKICASGLICINCIEEVGGYRCADADEPCCRNGQQDDFWCGQIAHPEGGFVSNLCCGNTCYSYDDNSNCGGCGIDCNVPSDSVCAVEGAAGTCGFYGGEDAVCQYPDLCANGYGGDTSLTYCSPFEYEPSAAYYFCTFFQGTGEFSCEGGGCACYIPPVVGRDPSLICVEPPTLPCYAGKPCSEDFECGSGDSQGICTISCTTQNNPFCGVGSTSSCVCP